MTKGNPIAKAVKTIRPKVVPSKKRYDRKAGRQFGGDPCPNCGTELTILWSGVKCPACGYSFCY